MKKLAAGILALTLVLGGGAFSGVSPIYEIGSYIEVSAEETVSISMLGTWEGTYQGHKGSTVIERKIALEIFKQTDGTFLGKATVDDGENGSYYLEGTIGEDGEVTFRGNEWITNPSNFTFAEMIGKIDENGDFVGLVDGEESKNISLKKTSDNYTDSSVSLADIPTDWIGEYDGHHNSVTVRRNYEFHIREINEDGSFNGVAVLSPSDKAEARYGATGSYYFAGNIDPETGHIQMQGNEWIDYPIGYDNFNFVELYGTVSPKDGTIKGGTERGIWDMSVIDYTKVKTASSFNLGEDNNSFVHSSNKDKWENAGFAGFDNYYINDEFYEKLTKGLEKGEKDRIDSEINHKWGGSCYGIAMTMGLVFEGKIDLEDITEGTPENYYLMSYPKDDDELISSINYYQLSQYLDRCSKDKISISTAYRSGFFGHLSNWQAENDSLSVFLKALVQSCNNDHVNVLSMGHKTGLLSRSGHAVLVTGSRFDEDTDEYVIDIYDENSVGDDADERQGKFTEMRIKKDYSDFTLYEPNGDVINKSNYRSFALIDWNKLNDVILDENPKDDGKTTLTIKFSDLIRIEAANGSYLEYDGEEFTGNMKIYGINDLAGDDDSESIISVITDNSDSFTITKAGSTVDMDVCSAKGYMSLSGSGITGAELSEKNGINISGKDMTFEASLSNYSDASRAANVIGISGKSAADVNITRDENKDISIKADKTVTDGQITYIKGNDTKTVSLEKKTSVDINSDVPVGVMMGDANLDDDINVTDISVTASHIKGIKPLDKDQQEAADVSSDGELTVTDIAMIASHIKGIKPLK